MNKTIGFIGSGKVAHSFIPVLSEQNYKIEFVVSKNREQIKSLKKKSKIENIYDSVEKISKCNFLFISVPDSKISEVAEQIASLKTDFEDTIFIHLSGSRSIDELQILEKKNYSVAGFHPMQSFPLLTQVSLKNAYAAIETRNEKIFNELSKLAKKLKMNPFQIFPDQKTAYHMMGVMISNFMTTSFFNADKLLENSENIPPSNQLLSAIAFQTLENIIKHNPVNSLSGPIDRGDFGTVEKHLKYLKNNTSLTQYYITNSLSIAEVALKKGSISEDQFREISLLLEKYL